MASNHLRTYSVLVTSIPWFSHSFVHQQKLWGQAESLPVHGNTSQVNISTLGVNSEAKDRDLNSEVNAVLCQVWISDSQQPICIPANSARIISGKSDRIA